MPSKINTYTIRKVEHEFGIPRIKPKFPKMPELYLELLINKKKVNTTLASEKYIHVYEPLISSEETSNNEGFKPIPRITSISKNIVEEKIKEGGTFTWQSSDSMEPSPIIQKKPNRLVSSSPVVPHKDYKDKTDKYRKVKKSIVSSYYKTMLNHNPVVDEEKPPPPIKEIKKTFGDGKPTINTFENYETAKDEDDQKRELLFKFHRLKKTYPKVNIPEFNMMSNHENMKRTYDTTVKNLAIDSTVENYKSYLMMGFMGCEIVLGKVGFDMEGYTQQQTLYMNKYEKLLIELGEKSYVPSSINKWPVEIRLIALVLFQTTIFVISKIVAKKTNFNILQMYNNVNGAYDTTKSKSHLNSSSSGFASAGSSPLTFIPKTKIPFVPRTESKMRGPSATRD